jgi:heme-degrading monooxygenase HmoA
MYAVIFRAEITEFDEAYFELGEKMRKLAIDKYGCLDFTAASEGRNEIAISYWKDLKQMKEWKKDTEHLVAQEEGRSKWYKSYKVKIVEIMHQYNYPATKNT